MSSFSRMSNVIKGDKVVWLIFFFLCIISLLEVFSASSSLTYKSGSYIDPLLKHGGLILLGFFGVIFTLHIPCRAFRAFIPVFYPLSIVTLIAVFFIGQSTNGAQRWMSILGIPFQPSEVAKGTIILIVAEILSRFQTDKNANKQAFKYILIVSATIIPLIFVENFSTAALISIVIILMMIVGKIPKRQIGKLLGIISVMIILSVSLVMLIGHEENEAKSNNNLVENTTRTNTAQKGIAYKIFHRADTWKARILNFTNGNKVSPKEYDLDKNAQVAHSRIAIVSSNGIGVGIGKSVERDFLSQAFSDFIYSVIIEEMGLLGAVIVVILYVALFFRSLYIADKCENSFPAFLVMGLSLMLVVQALFNMSVAVGLGPVTGQPLPLISKGGTSTFIYSLYIGAILSVSRTAKKRDETTESSLADNS